MTVRKTAVEMERGRSGLLRNGQLTQTWRKWIGDQKLARKSVKVEGEER